MTRLAWMVATALVLLSGCVPREHVAGVTVCPAMSVELADSCIYVPTAAGWIFSMLLTLWFVNQVSATRDAVNRIEKKLSEKAPAPRGDGERS